MTAYRRALALTALACVACGRAAEAPPQGAAVAAARSATAETAPAPSLRIARALLPESNRVRLAIDPAQASFSGRIEIAARAAAPTREFRLHARNLEIQKAVATAGASSWTLELLPADPEQETIGFRAPQELPAGALSIAIDYTGAIDDSDTLGIFRQREGDDWYAFTQFEALAARRAYPCLDEPDSKVPWQLTLEIPESLSAVSNTAIASEQKTGRGTKLVAFRETQPLPSYLVAFGVGPFDYVDAGATRRGTPIRVVAPRGRGAEARYAAENTAPILALLEDYFGVPYPYEKLDLLSIPLTVNFGAMENAGLVTFAGPILLARPEDFTIDFQRDFAYTAAHELAHQWFGDLVTLAWWDDLWLNEAFATWLEDKIVATWKPEWDPGVGPVTRRGYAMGADSLQSARRIREPIASSDDVESAFDGITYGKGAAVIEMFERFVGPEPFRAGVHGYLAKHARGNATAADFLAAVGEAAQRDVAPAFSTFLDQVGTPLVEFELSCAGDGPARLALRQSRYLPHGSAAAAQPQRWQIPICVKYRSGGEIAADCTLLAQERGELALSRAGCPAWLLPNDGELGYYRSALGGDLLPRLLEQGMPELSLPERVGVLGDVSALVTAARLDPGVALALVPRYAAAPERQLVESAVSIAADARDLVPDALRPEYERFVRGAFGARARQLGWKPAPGESEDQRILRRRLLEVATDDGGDRELAGTARELALAWMKDPNSVDPELAGLALRSAALRGDRELFERMYARAKQSDDRRDRGRLLGALREFRDPELLRRALAIARADDFDPRESDGLLFAGLRERSTRRLAYDAILADYDRVAARLPEQSVAELVFIGSAQCDAALRPAVQAFFEPRTSRVPGGPRAYAQGMEQMDLCIAQRQALEPGVAAFLRAH